MAQGDAAAGYLRAAGGRLRIPALEPAARVVARVGVVPVPDEAAGELDLVGRVVDVPPRRRRVAQPQLEHRRGDDERCGDDGGEREGRSRPAPWPAPVGDGARGDEHAGEDRDRAHHAEVPALVARADDERERPARDHLAAERPRLRAELRDVHDHERRQRRQERPPAADHPVNAGSRVGESGSRSARGRGAARAAAANARTNQVRGSSTKPL